MEYPNFRLNAGDNGKGRRTGHAQKHVPALRCHLPRVNLVHFGGQVALHLFSIKINL